MEVHILFMGGCSFLSVEVPVHAEESHVDFSEVVGGPPGVVGVDDRGGEEDPTECVGVFE